MRPVDTERAVGRGGRTTVPRGPVGTDRVGGRDTARDGAVFMPPFHASRDGCWARRPAGRPGRPVATGRRGEGVVPMGGGRGRGSGGGRLGPVVTGPGGGNLVWMRFRGGRAGRTSWSGRWDRGWEGPFQKRGGPVATDRGRGSGGGRPVAAPRHEDQLVLPPTRGCSPTGRTSCYRPS